jgi:hypothetical protein
MALRAPIDRPGLLWRGFVITGFGTMKALSFSDTAWAWWEEHVTDKVPRSVIRGVLAGAFALHAAEALSARRIAGDANLAHRGAYTRTTFTYGFPALRRTKLAAIAAMELPSDG